MGLFGRDESRDPQIGAAFAECARANGLTDKGAFPTFSLTGVSGGVPFYLGQSYVVTRVVNPDHSATRASGSWHCTVVVHDPQRLGDLDVTDEDGVARVARFFGARDHRVGWEEFDKAFMVNCDDEALMRRLLTPAACRALLDVWREKHRVFIRNQRVEYDLGHIVEDPREVDAMLRAVLHVTHALGR